MGAAHSEESQWDDGVPPDPTCLQPIMVYASAGHSYSDIDDVKDFQKYLVGSDDDFLSVALVGQKSEFNQQKILTGCRSSAFGDSTKETSRRNSKHQASPQETRPRSPSDVVPAWVLAAQLNAHQANGTRSLDENLPGTRCEACFSGLRRLWSKGYPGKSSGVIDMDMPSTTATSSSNHSPELVKEDRRDSNTSTSNLRHNATASRSRMTQHITEASWSPTLCLYDASMDTYSSRTADNPRRAYHIPVSGSRPCRVDNGNFTGSFIMLHRTPEGVEDDGSIFATSMHDDYFKGKSRRWEVRVQGKFKKQPVGELYTGCVLEDFDYSEEHTWSASAFASVFVPLMEVAMGHAFYFAWGTRGHDIDPKTQELATIVTSLAGVDQIIVTPAGETPPSIEKDISGMGYCRNSMRTEDYKAVAHKIAQRPNTEDTYTFCVWGCSPYIDCMRSELVGMFGRIPYGGFLGGWPAHFVLYSLPTDEQDPRHLEKDKTYFIDIMVWGSDMEVPELPARYNFLDARLTPEAVPA